MLTVVGDRPAGQKARSGLTESTPVGGVRQLPRSPAHPRQHSSNQFGRIARRTSPRNDARVRQSDDDHSAAALEGTSRPSSQILLDMFVDLTNSAQSPANGGERVAPEAQDQPHPERGYHRLVKGPARIFETSPIMEVLRTLGSDKDTVAGRGEARIEPGPVEQVPDALLHLRIASLLPGFVVQGEALGLAAHLDYTGPHRAKPLIRRIRAVPGLPVHRFRWCRGEGTASSVPQSRRKGMRYGCRSPQQSCDGEFGHRNRIGTGAGDRCAILTGSGIPVIKE